MVWTERRVWSPDEVARAKELGGQMTVSQIAAEIGRPVSSVYSLLNTASQTARRQEAKRPCMTCGKPFGSEGPHNRMCRSCRQLSSNPFER